MYVMHKLIKYFVPQLTICVVFAPLKARPPSVHQEIEETDTLSWANSPVSTLPLGRSKQGTRGLGTEDRGPGTKTRDWTHSSAWEAVGPT